MMSNYNGIGFDPSVTKLKYGRLQDGTFVEGNTAPTHVQITAKIVSDGPIDAPVYLCLYSLTPNSTGTYTDVENTGPTSTETIAVSTSAVNLTKTYLRSLTSDAVGTLAIALHTVRGVGYHNRNAYGGAYLWDEVCLDEEAWPVIASAAQPLLSVAKSAAGIAIGERWRGSTDHAVKLASDWILDAAMNQYSGLLQPLYDAIYPIGYVIWYPVTESTDAKRKVVLDAFVARMSQSVTHTRAGVTGVVLSSTWTYDIDTYVLGTGSFQSRRLYAITRTD